LKGVHSQNEELFMNNMGIDQYDVPEGSTVVERRSHDRFDLELKGTAVFDSRGRPVEGKVLSKNINGYGAYLLTHTRPQISDVVAVDLRDPADPRQPELFLGAVGKILRVDPLSKNAFGFAVTFDVIRPFETDNSGEHCNHA
jgi:hypothetical protein